MGAKQTVIDFYKSDALISSTEMEKFLHADAILDWNSSKGFLRLDKNDILNMTTELEKAYVRSKVRITHLVEEGDTVAVRYAHYVKTIENPREEMLLANFMIIWEIRDAKLFRGYQMSQLG